MSFNPFSFLADLVSGYMRPCSPSAPSIGEDATTSPPASSKFTTNESFGRSADGSPITPPCTINSGLSESSSPFNPQTPAGTIHVPDQISTPPSSVFSSASVDHQTKKYDTHATDHISTTPTSETNSSPLNPQAPAYNIFAPSRNFVAPFRAGAPSPKPVKKTVHKGVSSSDYPTITGHFERGACSSSHPRGPESQHRPGSADNEDDSDHKARKKCHPDSPPKLKQTRKTKEEIEADIIIEEDDGNLPEGYIGTYEDIRYFNLPQPPHNCGSDNIHELACKHWVVTPSASSCGLNCRTPNLSTEAFKCKACQDIVKEIIEKDLSDSEKQKIEAARAAGRDLFVLGFYVEFVTNYVGKHDRVIHGVTETVMSILQENYGRDCNITTAPEPVKYYSIVEQIQMRDEYRARKEFERQSARASSAKRKHDDATAPEETGAEPPKKRQRTKLDLGIPATLQPDLNSHGKRKAGDIDETPTKPSKQQRTRLPTIPDSVCANTRGQKRKEVVDVPLASSESATKLKASPVSVRFGLTSILGAAPMHRQQSPSALRL